MLLINPQLHVIQDGEDKGSLLAFIVNNCIGQVKVTKSGSSIIKAVSPPAVDPQEIETAITAYLTARTAEAQDVFAANQATLATKDTAFAAMVAAKEAEITQLVSEAAAVLTAAQNTQAAALTELAAEKDAIIAEKNTALIEKATTLTQHQAFSDQLYVEAAPIISALQEMAKTNPALKALVDPLVDKLSVLAAGPRGRLLAAAQAKLKAAQAEVSALTPPA